MTSMPRQAHVERKTSETQIEIRLNVDGSGKAEVDSGVPFLDHMLTLFSVHGFFDLNLHGQGDLDIDAHHTVEDVGIALGMAFKSALGSRKGIRRYGHAVVPMDEACATVTLDLSNRPFLVFQTPRLAERVGRFDTELAPEFFRAFCLHAGVTLHIVVGYGANTHHILEAVFKAWGRALDEATRHDERRLDVPSSKGTL